MLNNSYSITKILSIIFAFSLISSNLITNAQNKNSIEDIKKVQKNIREKDPQKAVSEVLTQKSKDTLVSKQKNLEIQIDQVNKKVKINNQNKGDTTIGIPNVDQLNDGINVDNQVVFSSKNNKFDVFVEALDGGMRQVINIKDSSAPTVYDFPVELLVGEKLVLNEDGSASVVTQDSERDRKLKEEINQKSPELKIKSGKSKIVIAKPWAKDANNKELSTSYSIINGNILRQTIDTKNAVFPVVADPLWCGSAVSSTNWFYNTGAQSSTYPNEFGWTLSVYPSWCGILGASTDWYSTYWSAWLDVCSANGTGGWCSLWNNDQYASMFYQYVCHYNQIGALKKFINGSSETVWNLDEWRPNVGWFSTVANQCNPKKL
jgi:hypothetical protein